MTTTTSVRIALASAALSLAAAACGGSTAGTADVAPASPSTSTVAPARATSERPTHLVDELVAIDGGRMHLRCSGRGDTTVLLLAGWGDGDGGWGAIEPAISRRARVCSYARFGTGESDAPPATQTFTSQVADLHELLDAADEPGPYVVLGHSFGGAEAVAFASTYADEVTGLLLLDATPPTWPEVVCSVPAYAGGCAVMRDPALDPERLDVFRTFEAVAAIATLDDLPLTVVTAVHRDPQGLTPGELDRLDLLWAEGMQRWAALSSASQIVQVEDTGHHIEVDQPEVVVEELLRLLA